MARSRSKAAEATEPAGDQPTGTVHTLSPVPSFIRRIRTSKQALVDTQMGHASIYKEAEEAGLHRAALKDTVRLAAQDIVKTQAYLKALVEYLIEANVLADGALTFVQGDIEDVAPAA